jgi:hypothetical protein
MEERTKAGKIGASRGYEYCRGRLSPFGGLLGLVKFMDLVNEEIFRGLYKAPGRTPGMGHYIKDGLWHNITTAAIQRDIFVSKTNHSAGKKTLYLFARLIIMKD